MSKWGVYHAVPSYRQVDRWASRLLSELTWKWADF